MIALIPARSGSKEIKNKNIKLFNKKPLIAHSIISAKKSRYIKEVYLITDSIKIAKIGKKFGAKVPFLRPKYLAKDNSKAIDTYIFFLKKIKKQKLIKDLVVLLPTSPLRKTRQIDEAIKLYNKNKVSSLISVKELEFPVQWIKTLKKYGGKVVLRNNYKNHNLNRQRYNKYFIPNGSIFIFNAVKLMKYKKYYYKNTMPYIMNKQNSIDIDDKLDFDIAEFLMRKGKY